MKWQTVQIWRRKRKGGTTYALRWGSRDKPFTKGLGRCTEEYAELQRRELEKNLNAIPKGHTNNLIYMRRELSHARFTDSQIDQIVRIVERFLPSFPKDDDD